MDGESFLAVGAAGYDFFWGDKACRVQTTPRHSHPQSYSQIWQFSASTQQLEFLQYLNTSAGAAKFVSAQVGPHFFLVSAEVGTGQAAAPGTKPPEITDSHVWTWRGSRN